MGGTLFKFIEGIKDGIFEVIYPKKYLCLVCEEEEIEGICEKCIKDIKKCNENEISYAYYNSTLKKLILDFKFRKNFNSGELLSDFIVEKLKNEEKDYILTYVPISKNKLKVRGFNQCEYLCKEASKKLNVDVLETLKQVKEIRAQKTLNKEQREKNILNAFEAINIEKIKGRNIVLVDDVITTGATIRECERILKKYGVNKIKLLTIGKSDI